ncbi:MAG: lysine--tRNA ligase [candidate division Zixibacteria bacterium]|nr:lysine--tRNA ligase [candidate division Zixibacteria bacterium]MDD5426743.1 lysine--tRNA ligase [candidate division Zixibacteria bacterium]
MNKDHSQPSPDPAAEIQMPLAELIKIRREKVIKLRQMNINPYPYRYEVSHGIGEVLDQFTSLAEKQTALRLAGRIMLKRKMGKSFFAHFRDASQMMQIYLKLDVVGQEAFDLFNLLDLGDIIGCEGTLFITKTGERTLRVHKFELLAKSLHPLPDKHAGLTDVETRYRRRYADLIINPEVREVFIRRSRIIQIIREYLNSHDFLEVETPILQPLYGGGMARPFTTHHEKLDMNMYLRIADELYLKRLIVGGYDKVWEYCKDFRNEGLDRLHNPEFSMIELYWAYADYKDIARLFEDLLRHTVFTLYGKYKIPYGEYEIDFEPPFQWVTMIGSIAGQTGIDFTDMSYEEARAAAKKLGVEGTELINRGKVIEAVWENKVEKTLIQPTFVADFPVEISPLAKKHREDDRLTERFELFIAAQETGNAFSELNDPVDQLERFLQQGKAIEAGDKEAQPLDDDFVTALSYGMPPTGGLGFGIDRLIMLLTNQHTIRDVILYPQMKDYKEGTVPVSKILRQLLEEEKNKSS